MKKILITRRLLKSNEDKASKIFDTKLNSNDELYSQTKLIKLSKGCDGILTLITDKIDEKTINKLPDTVKIISNFAVGFGNIDLKTAKKSNWKFSVDFLIGKQLTGARLGILGMGRIGTVVEKLARAFGMIIHNHNRSKLSSELAMGATYHDSIKGLFSISDFLSINCPATKETENIINAETLKYFPAGAIITNSARGDMIDDEAMINALNKKKIYALGLDVYKGEPNLNPGYLNIKDVFILPHLGSATKETRTAMGSLALDNIDEFFKTGKCKNKVN